MGQYWKILNVKKGMRLHNPAGMKLPELLMNKRAKLLVELLNAPRLYKVLLPPVGLAYKKAESHQSRARLFVLLALAASQGAKDYHWRTLGRRPYDLCEITPKARQPTAPIPPREQWKISSTGTRMSIHNWDELSFARCNPLYQLAEYRQYNPKNSSLEAEVTHWLDLADKAQFNRLYALMKRSYTSPRPGILRNLDTKQLIRDQVLAQDGYDYSLGGLIILSTTRTVDGAKAEWAGCRVYVVCEDDFDMRDGWRCIELGNTIAWPRFRQCER